MQHDDGCTDWFRHFITLIRWSRTQAMLSCETQKNANLGKWNNPRNRCFGFQGPVLGLFCGSCGEVWGEWNSTRNGYFVFHACFGVILRLLSWDLGKMEKKRNGYFGFQMHVLALFCGSCREVCGKWNNPQNSYFGSQVSILRLFCGSCREFGENEVAPSAFLVVILRLVAERVGKVFW